MAARACALSCRHRTAAGWLSAVAEPQLPVAVARQAPLHTWPAYRDAIRYLVIDVDWEELVTTCARLRVDIRFVWGERDAVGDRVYAEQLTSGRAGHVDVPDHGDHRLPLTNPAMCISHLTDGLG